MNYKINLLSPKDKLFMILNRKIFSDSTRTIIDINHEKWANEIKEGLSSEEIEKSENERIILFKEYTNFKIFLNKIFTKDYYSNRSNLFDGLQYETKLDIRKTLLFIFNIYSCCVTTLYYDKEKKFIADNTIKRYFHHIFYHNLTAHIIHQKINFLYNNNNENIYDFDLENVKSLLSKLLICESKDDNYVATILYLIIKYLNSTEDEIFKSSIIQFREQLFGNNSDKLKIIISGLISGSTDFISMSKSIYDDNDIIGKSCFLKILNSSITTNYEKNKICDNIGNGCAGIGDNILPEGLYTEDIIPEIRLLINGRLKKYLKDDGDVSYIIDERTIGYLKSIENVPICKVAYGKSEHVKFVTLTKVDDKSFLLFKINSRCYGISFPADNNGDRKILNFTIPENKDYKLVMI